MKTKYFFHNFLYLIILFSSPFLLKEANAENQYIILQDTLGGNGSIDASENYHLFSQYNHSYLSGISASENYSNHQGIIRPDLYIKINTNPPVNVPEYTREEYELLKNEMDAVIVDLNSIISSMYAEEDVSQMILDETQHLSSSIDAMVITQTQLVNHIDELEKAINNMYTKEELEQKIDQANKMCKLTSGYSRSFSQPGWYLVSAIKEDAIPKTIPEDSIEVIYQFEDGGYQESKDKTLKTGYGYWVKVLNPCEFIVELD